MYVLIPDRTTPVAESAAQALEAHGHIVVSCQSVAYSNRPGCRTLEDEPCPLDTYPVDVVVDPGPGDKQGEGALCGLRRRIPLLLSSDHPDHCLEPWATDMVESDYLVKAVEDAHASPLPGHSAVGEAAVLGQLRRTGIASDQVGVEVRRHNGGLVVDVWFPESIGRQDANRVAVHMTQVISAYDAWAHHLDVRIHLLGEVND